jgi:hypothetical protein
MLQVHQPPFVLPQASLKFYAQKMPLNERAMKERKQPALVSLTLALPLAQVPV